MLDGTHSYVSNWARNPTLDGGKGCAEVGATESCLPATKQIYGPSRIKIPDLTCDRVVWENFVVAEASAWIKDSNAESKLKSVLGAPAGLLLTIASLAMALDPVLESSLMIDHGATTPMAEGIYGNCERNTVRLSAVDTVTNSLQEPMLELSHIYPIAPVEEGDVGVCTCKGQRAYAFTSDGQKFPYRSAAQRRVIYDAEYYNSAIDAARPGACN
jgi:hypothetical protein